ncbi:ATP-binding cassette transporter snq2 [Naganishia albida]|nr:ATP-binding cassette transporter snq2 [Naganishia albida]
MSHLPPAPENVRLASYVHTNEQHTFSNAPTLAPSRHSGSEDEKAPQSHTIDIEKAAHGQEYNGDAGKGYYGEENVAPVDVEKAKAQFADLQRSLSRQSSLHRARTRQSGTSQADLEKQEDEDQFNLAEYIRGGHNARDEQGFSHKEVGVVWDHLRVIGGGGLKIHVRTFPNAIMEQFIMPVFSLLKVFGLDLMSPKPRDLLHDFSGYLKPGEMCLVLARPGGGASTFLKTITNNRESYLGVEGDVLYQGVTPKEMKARYAGEVIYSMEDDIHLPTLTVQQTLELALKMKTPGKLIEGVTQKQFREEMLDTLLKMLNISHTKRTLVGNEYVRGVSGGERKRVSIAEAFCGQGCVISWDNSTRGLDASTALDYAKSIRIITDIMKMTTFVSLYQAGEGIYDQFDKVLVIDNGRQVYFGPAKEARAYMIGLGFADKPRQTTADYLTGCTDPNEREYQPGKSADNVPSTPEALEEAYWKSEIFQRMEAERKALTQEMTANQKQQEDFRQAVEESKRKGVGKKSPYVVSFGSQVLALFQRQLQLQAQDKLTIYTGFFTSIAIAFITGSVFYQLPQTASGAFTRGGVLFIAMLFNALNAFSELPAQMGGRNIMYKQVGYRFYRPGALAVAQTLADLPINALKILLFGIIVYFMSGLASTAGAFFTFYLFVFSSYLVMSAFFRVLGTGTQTYDVAARLASVLISLMVIYAGYMIPVNTMKRWLFWIYYLNPLSYGFESLMINEFKRLNLACDAAFTVPSNRAGFTGFGNTVTDTTQTCTLQGSQPGQNNVPGMRYLEVAFDYRHGHQWRNFGILVGFFLFFSILQIICMEYIARAAANIKAIVVFAKENKDTKVRNERLQERKAALAAGKINQDLAGLVESRRPFTWENLCYTVPVPGGQRQLLKDVFGYVKPGTLTALMGASGAGKTTLLDVLAARKTTGVIGGDIKINGRAPDVTFQKGTAYVEQQDVHEWTTTVREAMRYSAYLRQPAHVPKAEKDDYVEEILELLELQDLADAMIGFPGYGLSVEARKRLTIGVELASKPQLLLFLDEPTSGLDGQSAFNIVRFLRKLAAAGQAILCTIHQPNAVLFENFDRLLLLQRGGECVYFGGVGKDSNVLVDYLERNGAPVPHDANPAEFMLEAIGAGSRKRMGGGDWHEKWLNSPEFSTVKEEITELNAVAMQQPDEKTPDQLRAYSTSFWFQFKTILKRDTIKMWRDADYQYTRLFSHMAIALVTSLTFLQLGNNARDLQYRVFAIFIVTVLPAIIIAQIEPHYIMARMVFNREASSKMYSTTVFATSQIISEMPYSVLCAAAFYLLWYFPIWGTSQSTNRQGYQFAMVLITEVFSVTLGQAVAALSPSIFIAALFNPFLLVIFSLLCGVTIPGPQLNVFYNKFLYNVNPFRFLVSGMIAKALHGVEIRCDDNETYQFTTPAGQTCGEYAGAFTAAQGAYLVDPNATGTCNYCQYASGDTFMAGVGVNYATAGRDIGIYCAYILSNIFIILVAAKFLTYAKR